MLKKIKLFTTLVLGIAVSYGAGPASAASPAAFFKGKNVTIITATGAGSGYGIYGRVIAHYMKAHIPGKPSVVMQFMPGGGGSKMLNYLYNAAPKDGTFIGFPLKFLAINVKIGRKGLKYDPTKFGYLGSLGPINAVAAVWKATSPATTLADMKIKQVIMGSTGKSSGTYITPTLMNNLLGTKFKVVTGYRGLAPIELAMESGEVHGRVASWSAIKTARSHWLKDKSIALVAQTGLERNFDLPNLPTLLDLAKTKDAKDIISFFAIADTVGWLMITPPGVPEDRFDALRNALAKTTSDEAFVADARKRKIHVSPKPGPEIAAMINETMSTSPALMVKIKKAMGTN
jgi:tripartite-type tricarboxylate transporter receptor subunit TctC